ncbi:tannase/feruloyl esterase family alpha/beta hydrolase [Sphingomonas oryzagri]|uniref:Tannase/feruloyl esterase family alpha/beta hydrolase n=1 Tax=Sphingomonas oryzagri TaxID=3042314 RepID=A0ABT6N1T4_9SPHN|nr:tannase/feruloyl esterase family alpha/beta hydrolase [Sphingomonas oryzagri]MDH7639256.1 tannase/feruloyl esterase family alpha/beta hydrolase [Sphingomonas oryzagri]
MIDRIRLGRGLGKLLCIAACLGLSVPANVAPPKRSATPADAQPLALPAVPAAVDCASLRSADVSRSVGAKTVVADATIADDQAPSAYCDVHVVVDDYARFELRLPARIWTQRLLFGGGPGAQAAPGIDLSRFATVSWEDLGRRQNEDVFANDYRAHVNAGYRGMHLQVLAAKALIARYYGQGPRFSYWNACSNPGREGMIEAQRFPGDFDGIGAGCPPLNTTMNNGLFHAWGVRTNTGPDGAAILTMDKLPILHKAVLDQCDAADGAKDGIVSDPFSCHPALAAIECRPGENPASCLTPAQVHVAEELYRGAHDAAGHRLTPGGVMPGSELAWTATVVPGARFGGPDEDRLATERAIRSHYSLPALPATWRLSDLRFDQATFDATTALSPLHDGTNPDLSGFAKAGHKLMLFMSLGDTNVLPQQTILYYLALQRQMGPKAVDGFARFYLLPGVYHCGGGDGPVIRNLLLPLMAWVERGVAPGALAGVHVPQGPDGRPQDGTVSDLTRPIFPYPYTARYTGKGDVRDAANWVKGPARPAPATLWDWPGAKFYTPGHMKWCSATATALQCRSTQ